MLRNRNRSCRLFCAILLVSAYVAAPAVAQTRTEQIETLLAKYHEYDLFNGSVLVAEEGEVLYKGGFGDANMAWNVPNMPGTKFRIGSVTKQFTAALILQLVEEGKINLDATVSEYLPDYSAAQGDRVTIHQLLTHTSGIPSYTGLPDYSEFSRDPYEPDSFLTVFSGLDLEFEPGTQWTYSNSNYFLLGVIIEEVTGQPYDEALRERILEPFGLNNTGYDHHGDIIEHRATGYVKKDGGYEHAPYFDTSVPYAAGMIYSTVEDLFKWDQVLYENGPFQKAETKELMFKPHVALSEAGTAHYGYGWIVARMSLAGDSIRIMTHSGGIPGFRTGFWRMPEERRTVIVLDNTSSGKVPEIGRGLMHILYGEDAPALKRLISAMEKKVADVPEEVLESYVGKYELNPGFVFTVTRQGDQLYVQATGQPRSKIFPETETEFYSKVVNAQFTFNRTEQGEVESLTLHQGGQDMPAEKIE